MTDAEFLTHVKKALGITGEYQDDTIKEYIADQLKRDQETDQTAAGEGYHAPLSVHL